MRCARWWVWTWLGILLLTTSASANCRWFVWLHRHDSVTRRLESAQKAIPIYIADLQDIADIAAITDPTERAAAERRHTALRDKSMLEKSFTVIDWALGMWIVSRAAMGFTTSPEDMMDFVMKIPVALFTADLFSHITHVFLDRYASKSNPFWGTTARAFDHHHTHPDQLSEESYLTRSASVGMGLLPVFIGGAFIEQPDWGAAVSLFLLTSLNSSEFHHQAHQEDPGFFFRTLRMFHLAIDKEHHDAHHPPPYDQNYGIVNGWSNHVPGIFLFWSKLDLLLWKWKRRISGVWLQSPAHIPESVVREMSDDLSVIPLEFCLRRSVFDDCSSMAQPLQAVMPLATEMRIAEYVADRRNLYLDIFAECKNQDQRNRVRGAWLSEQLKFPIIFGSEPLPL